MRYYALVLLIALLAFPLSGCWVIWAGGAGAAGGYYAGAEERTVGTVVDDATITGAIKTKYIGEKDISAININVDTYRGVVTLYGSVPSKATEDKAVRIAWSVKGVKQVVSKLTVVPE